MTPIARIEYDRAFMEKVLAEAGTEEEKSEQKIVQLNGAPTVLLLFALLNILCMIVMAVGTHFDMSKTLEGYFSNTWALLAFAPQRTDYGDIIFSTVTTVIFFAGPILAVALIPADKLLKISQRK